MLWQRPVACGVAYGLVLYAVMNYVVVPLSAAEGGGSKDPLWIGLSIAVHALLIGPSDRALRAAGGAGGQRARGQPGVSRRPLRGPPVRDTGPRVVTGRQPA